MANTNQQLLPLYLSLMEEIKVRFQAITIITASNLSVPQKIIEESCLLQIRMVCELIGLACLVAHGDITKSNKLTKVYQADRIISTLEELHPKFFPAPVTMTFNPGHVHFEPLKSGFLTKSEFLRLYNQRCGGSLHRGSLKNLLSPRRQSHVDFDELRVWVNKIMRLLDKHVVFLRDGNTLVLCQMDNGKEAVQVAIAAAPPLASR